MQIKKRNLQRIQEEVQEGERGANEKRDSGGKRNLNKRNILDRLFQEGSSISGHFKRKDLQNWRNFPAAEKVKSPAVLLAKK